MKILHIFKTEPDAETRRTAHTLSEGREATLVSLHSGSVDYGDLVKQIFEHDQVVCWW